MDYTGFGDAPPDDLSLRQAWANLLRGMTNKQSWQELGQGIQNTAQIVPNVAESVARGGVAGTVGALGGIRDMKNSINSYLPESVQNWQAGMETLANPMARALIQKSPNPEAVYEAVPRVTSPYEGYKQHETIGEYVGPPAAGLLADALKFGKGLPVGASIKAVDEAPKLVRDELGMYSRLDEVVNELPQEKGTGQQFLNQIAKTKGVKPEEISYRGLDTFLQNNPKITKSEIQAFLADNPAGIKQTILGERPKYDANRLAELETEYNALKEHPVDSPTFGEEKYDELIKLQNLRDNSTVDSLYKAYDDAIENAQIAQRLGKKQLADQFFKQAELLNTRAEKLDLEGLGAENPTKFHNEKFNLPNGENYREVLIQAPVKDQIKAIEASSDGDNWTVKMENGREISFPERMANDQSEAFAYAENQTGSKFVNATHFEQPNILAHMRVNDRVIDGKKTLFLEEVQSDWHQKGHSGGYAQKLTPAEEKEYYDIGRKFSGDRTAEEATRYNQLRQKQEGEVPDAPFKGNWHELAMKKAMQMAAEGGYDRVAFTTGAQQAKRYDLSKEINKVNWVDEGGGKGHLTAYDHDGKVVIEDYVNEKEIPDYIGKELAKKLTNEPVETWLDKHRTVNKYELEGLDIKTGGEFHQNFYDKKLPKFVNEFGEKLGIKVGKTNLNFDKPKIKQELYDGKPVGYVVNTPDDIKKFKTKKEAQDYVDSLKGEEVHYFDINPKAKSSLLEKGSPLFAAPAIGLTGEESRREILEKLMGK